MQISDKLPATGTTKKNGGMSYNPMHRLATKYCTQQRDIRW